MTLGEKLKACRNKKDYTQEYVATTIGYSDKKTVIQHENDKKIPKPDILEKYAELYEVDIEYLKDDSELEILKQEQEQIEVERLKLQNEINNKRNKLVKKCISFMKDMSGNK